MAESATLIDTPKRGKLQSQANDLKIALKDFERTFAAEHDGKKPGREDIKANAEISSKYKEYNKLRDVIAGKLGIDALNVPSQQEQNARIRQRKHHRTDSAISLNPHRPHSMETPSKGRYHPSQLDPYDAPGSASPKVMLQTVGPTPHRDGTILGIFDMLYSSGGSRKSSQETPSGGKRKIDVLYADAVETRDLPKTITQPPRRNQDGKSVSQAEHLSTSVPRSGAATGRRNHSKTPVSESKRFMLQHFFTTPSAVRFATMLQDEAGADARTPAVHKTPLRDQVLGVSPAKGQVPAAADATPPYLKRSFSFKERLLSVSGIPASPSSSQRLASPTSTRILGPRTLPRAKFAPKPLSQIIADRASQQNDQPRAMEVDDNDDDLDALREMEEEDLNVPVGDSKSHDSLVAGDFEGSARTWKKKGQKRTTRRAIMKPTRMKPAAAPRFVAADDDEAEDDDGDGDDDDQMMDPDVSRVEETQHLPDDDELEYLIAEAEQAGHDEDYTHDTIQCDWDDDNEDPFLADQAASDVDVESPVKRKKSPAPSKNSKSHSKFTSRSSRALQDTNGSELVAKATTKSKSKTKKPKAQKKDAQHNGDGDDDDDDDNSIVARKINPNAQSHMNFRSLKIRNKNSRAKGVGGGRGYGRFGRNNRRR
ncbi:uncharacterized protein A1O9_00862 [Exophiala aquamarina CBS 119918]|uniref:DNA replication regulator SLD2 n=1 Tax=Exophiala aquamarina CBS 119918 TaxID=1182545 RepID=A0A072PU70_9EURO|nr:uncharacterized protein A1O9_00862 [Exophiala aquamarina CBS 119918]KEF62888.1 hypothetical protein A1O9_00862 [Exophiala aquamarina CBS 119918]